MGCITIYVGRNIFYLEIMSTYYTTDVLDVADRWLIIVYCIIIAAPRQPLVGSLPSPPQSQTWEGFAFYYRMGQLLFL